MRMSGNVDAITQIGSAGVKWVVGTVKIFELAQLLAPLFYLMLKTSI